MRRTFSVMAIVLAALGLVWLVRLERSAPGAQTPAAALEGPASAPTSGAALPAGKPARVLGRIGGVLPHVLVDPRLVVEKSRRTLSVFSAGRPVKTYRIALGGEPEGDKVRQGDRRTPEGHLYVCAKNEGSRFFRSLGLSYPDDEDAERGVAAGLITKREQRAIADAIRHYRRPPWNTRLGGEIMIHGGGTGTDWTTGCVALSDSDIGELFPRIPLGTSVEIRP
ncbi:MAG TPA: L,D-transpeptidase family protein [Coriobacteriia bacterium]